MTSKTFFQSSVVPKLIHRYANGARAIEVWTTSCIVANFGRNSSSTTTTAVGGASSNCSILINPSNPELSGVSNFPYFPRGGPVPATKPESMHKDWQPLGFVSNWGGMEVGNGMLYAVSVVDGLVHSTGGWKLQAELKWLRLTTQSQSGPCPVGSAVQTSAGNETLAGAYDTVIHTTPPFYKFDADPENKLASCYKAALDLACNEQQQNKNNNNITEPLRIATPLLGSGARGFSYNAAIRVASAACIDWCHHHQESSNGKQTETTIAFGMLELDLAQQLSETIQRDAEAR